MQKVPIDMQKVPIDMQKVPIDMQKVPIASKITNKSKPFQNLNY